MTLHLVGETIDAKHAHGRAQQGELIQLFRGIYVEELSREIITFAPQPRCPHSRLPKRTRRRRSWH
jgi:hypothetical protein